MRFLGMILPKLLKYLSRFEMKRLKKHRIAFIGAGAIARGHAYALSALPHYYDNIPNLELIAVSSLRKESRDAFAKKYGFQKSLETEALLQNKDFDTLFILSPLDFHFAQFKKALTIESVKRIYLEKPVCATPYEEESMIQLSKSLPKGKQIQVGFQFLQMSTVRKALQLWKAGKVGKAIHFHARYLHSGYLNAEYRAKRQPRLKPIPKGGAISDLGAHAFSLLVAFFGETLEVLNAQKSGRFEDVHINSDLCTTALLKDRKSGAIGTLLASRVSAGTGEVFALEIRGSKGALRLSTEYPDHLEFFNQKDGKQWTILNCSNDYQPDSNFPAANTSPGWLRALVHAHYLFFGGKEGLGIVPELNHGLQTQRLMRQTYTHLLSDSNI